MKKALKITLKVIKWIVIVLILLVLLALLVRFIGQRIYKKTPSGGINEEMMIDVNGSKQWISIYGENKDNPVLLYLHGGPGEATSLYDYAYTRKWADVYTVVTWDQRNCGKSIPKKKDDSAITYDQIMTDAIEVTKYVEDHLGKDKITILGHSWGSMLGAELVYNYPELYDCFIGTGQVVDFADNEAAFKAAAEEWAAGDPEGMKLVEKYDPDKMDMEHFRTKNKIMQKYGYDMMHSGTDYSIFKTIYFNPYYSLFDIKDFITADMDQYLDFLASDELKKFSLKDKKEYKVPFYNINGDMDYQANSKLAQEYFDSIKAPVKKMYIMKDMTHGLLASRSEEFSDIVHEIAKAEKIE